MGDCFDYVVNWCGKSQPEGDRSLHLVPDCMSVEEGRIAMMHVVVIIPLVLILEVL